MAKEVPQMIRGLGLAMRLISSLTDEIKTRGGHEEMLHFLTTERGKQNLAKVADLIVSLEWRVPKSLMMRLARELCLENGFAEHAEFDSHIRWLPLLKGLGIPDVSFTTNTRLGDFNEYLDDAILDQLIGRPLVAGLTFKWNETEYVVVDFGEPEPKIGTTIQKRDIDWLHGAPVEYFDLDH